MTPFLTAIALATVDHAHLLQPGRYESVIGVGLFLCRIEDRAIDFDLRVCVLSHDDFPGDLIDWLSDKVPERGGLTAYRLRDHVVPALDRLPLAASSPVMAELHQHAPRPLLDLRGVNRSGEPLPFHEACAALHIPSSARDPAERFIDWTFDRTDRAAAALELDAIATFRLAMHRFRGGAPHTRRLARKVEPALKAWLNASERDAALLHRSAPFHP